jgi:hypothetical protein
MPSRSSPVAPVLIALLILAIPLGAYVAGYYLLGERTDWFSTQTNAHETIERSYPSLALMLIYQPAGKLESLLRRMEVEITLEDE